MNEANKWEAIKIYLKTESLLIPSKLSTRTKNTLSAPSAPSEVKGRPQMTAVSHFNHITNIYRTNWKSALSQVFFPPPLKSKLHIK